MIKKSTNQLLYIDSIRALAAIYVVLHHAILQYYNPALMSGFSAWKRWAVVPFLYGTYAVSLFIVLSGFSLMLGVIRNGYRLPGGAGRYLKKRVTRILPPYYFAGLFSLLLIWLCIGVKTGTHWDVSIPINWTDIFTHFFLVHDFFSASSSKINHAFWSISVECRIYLFFPFLVWLWRRRGMLAVLFASFVITVLGSILLAIASQYYPGISIDNPGVSPFIVLFVLGMIVADLSFSGSELAMRFRQAHKKSSFIKKTLCCLVLIGLIVFFKVLSLRNGAYAAGHAVDILFGTFCAYLLFLCSSLNYDGKASLPGRLLTNKYLVLIGTFSYSLYLIHAPLLQVMSQYIIPLIHSSFYASGWFLLAVGTPVIIALSWLFFLVFERPFLTSGRKRAGTQAAVIGEPAP